jgi:AcrR family transcriptional regulator
MERNSETPGHLRVDAERNRTRIVEAAQADFARRGLDVPLEVVADHAGVGIATLYRRFPKREDLISACFERRLEEYVAAAEEAVAAPNAWLGFCAYVERVCSMQAADRGFNDIVTMSFSNSARLEEIRMRGYEASVRMIERAQAEGTLRPDFVPEDLVLLLMANGGVVQAACNGAPDAWKRLVGLLLDGFRSAGASELPSPPSPRQIVTAMRRLAGSNDETRSVA